MNNLSDREIREKLASRGVEALSDVELLNILLQDGTSVRPTSEIVERLLERYGGSLTRLSRIPVSELRTTEGIGMKRASLLATSFELGRRIRQQEAQMPTVIRNSEDVIALFAPTFAQLRHEEMWVAYLSSANGVIEKRRVSQGGVSSLVVDHKLIVKRAIELLATSLILVHNHPSGIAEASDEDIALTQRISDAAILFDITVIDHIILSENGYFSFRSHGLIGDRPKNPHR